MVRHSACWIAALAVTLSTTWAAAQESPLSLFSRDVAVLIRLSEPDSTVEKVAALAEQVQPGTGEAVQQQLGGALGQMISNPTLTGVDQSRDWYAGVYAEGNAEPVVVFAIPAIDADDMVSALEGVTTKVSGRWVLYAEAEEIPVAAPDATVASELGTEIQASFDGGDFSVFVNVDRLSDVYSDQIDAGQDQVLELLNSLRFMPPQPGLNMEAVIELYGSMAEGVFQAVRDGRSLVVAANVNESGIAIDELLEFQEGFTSSEFLARHTPSALEFVDRLPAGATVYYGVSGLTKDLTRWGMELSLGMFGEQTDAEAMERVLGLVDQVELGTMAGSFDISDSPTGAFQGAGVVETNPSDKWKEATRASMRAMGELDLEGFKQTVTIQEDAETFGNSSADVITVKQEFDEDADPFGLQQTIQNFLFGPDGMQYRMAYLDGKTVTTMGGGREAMENLIIALDEPGTSPVAAARKLLQPQANIILLADIPTLVARGLKAASKVEGFPLPVDEQMIDNLALEPSQIGFAASTAPNLLRLETRIPVEQLRGFAKLGILFAALQQPQF